MSTSILIRSSLNGAGPLFTAVPQGNAGDPLVALADAEKNGRGAAAGQGTEEPGGEAAGILALDERPQEQALADPPASSHGHPPPAGEQAERDELPVTLRPRARSAQGRPGQGVR